MSKQFLWGTIVVIVIIAAGFWWYSSKETAIAPGPAFPGENNATGTTNAPTQGVVCTQEAMRCPDGSFVSRTGPKCEFAPCPGESKTAPTPAAVTVNVTGSKFLFDPKTITVKKGQTVTIHFTNRDGMHDWGIDEFNARTPVIQAGQSADVTFVASKVGSFEYYCSVGTHRAMGMKGTLVVQ